MDRITDRNIVNIVNLLNLLKRSLQQAFHDVSRAKRRILLRFTGNIRLSIFVLRFFRLESDINTLVRAQGLALLCPRAPWNCS